MLPGRSSLRLRTGLCKFSTIVHILVNSSQAEYDDLINEPGLLHVAPRQALPYAACMVQTRGISGKSRVAFDPIPEYSGRNTGTNIHSKPVMRNGVSRPLGLSAARSKVAHAPGWATPPCALRFVACAARCVFV